MDFPFLPLSVGIPDYFREDVALPLPIQSDYSGYFTGTIMAISKHKVKIFATGILLGSYLPVIMRGTYFFFVNLKSISSQGKVITMTALGAMLLIFGVHCIW